MRRKVLIIGGNRFFGLRLARQLLKDGHHVTILNRGQHGDDLGSSVQRIICDRSDANLLAAKVSGQRWDLIYDQVCFDAHEAKAACTLFAGKTERYIFTSSQSVYGPGPDQNEDAFDARTHAYTKIVGKLEDYSEAKRQCETMFFSNDCPFPVCAVRFPIVLGPDDYTGRLKFHVEHVRNGTAIAVPNLAARISFIHSADAAAGLALLGQSSFTGPINLAALVPIAVGDVIKELETVLGIKANVTAAGATSPFGIENDWYMNCHRARALGFEPRPIRSWLKDVILGY